MVRLLHLMLILLSLSALLLAACGGETESPSAEITDDTLTDIGEAVEAEVVAALEAGEDLDPDSLAQTAVDSAEEAFAEQIDEDTFGNVSEGDLPLPLACDILREVDLNGIMGAEMSHQPFDMPTVEGAPFHVSMCTYANDSASLDDPYLSATLTVRQPKPGASIVSPADALAEFEAGADAYLDEGVDIEPIDGFNGIAVYSMGTLSVFRPDGSMLTVMAGEGMGDLETTLALASAVDALLRN